MSLYPTINNGNYVIPVKKELSLKEFLSFLDIEYMRDVKKWYSKFADLWEKAEYSLIVEDSWGLKYCSQHPSFMVQSLTNGFCFRLTMHPYCCGIANISNINFGLNLSKEHVRIIDSIIALAEAVGYSTVTYVWSDDQNELYKKAIEACGFDLVNTNVNQRTNNKLYFYTKNIICVD